MSLQPFDHGQIVNLANDMLFRHGEAAVGYICDRIVESMGGDPIVEDLWHAVLDIVALMEVSGDACSTSHLGTTTLQ